MTNEEREQYLEELRQSAIERYDETAEQYPCVAMNFAHEQEADEFRWYLRDNGIEAIDIRKPEERFTELDKLMDRTHKSYEVRVRREDNIEAARLYERGAKIINVITGEVVRPCEWHGLETPRSKAYAEFH